MKKKALSCSQEESLITVPKAHNGGGGQTEVQRRHWEVSPFQACTFASISCSAGRYRGPSTGKADEGQRLGQALKIPTLPLHGQPGALG